MQNYSITRLNENAPDELLDYQHLWDGTENWVLHAFHRHQLELTIAFQAERPSIREMMALRKLMPELGDMPVQQLKALIGDSRTFTLGKHLNSAAQPLKERAVELGLTITSVDASSISYLPIHENESESMALIIEDDDLSNRVAQRMLAEGVPVTDTMHLE